MKVGDTVKVIDEHYLERDYFIDLIGKVVKVYDGSIMNIAVKFKSKDNKDHHFSKLIDNKRLHFDAEELEIIL